MVKTKDRWSSLSMSEKDALFKIYVSNGITSLDDIKKDYNSFAPGGTLENADEAATAFNPQDTSWDYERVTQNDAEKARQGSIDFYKRWYQSPAREAQGFNAFYEIAREDYELPNADNNEIYEGKYSNGDYSKYLDLNGDGNIDWDETVRVTPMPILPVPKGMGPTVELEGGIKARNWLYDSRIYDDAYTQYRDFISDENLEDLTVEVTSDMPGNLLGSYSASDGNKVKVYRYVGDELQPIITHEGTHKLTRNVLPGSYRDVSEYFAPYTTDETFKSTYSDSYADSTREVYARLNQLRDKLGLDPYKTYTKEDLETIRSNFVDDYFFTRYDDDTLLQLLNNSFKDGGKLNTFATGGDTNGDNNNNSITPTERKLTLEEFLQAKADSTRVAALENSRNRTEGVEIVYPLSEEDKQNNMYVLEKYYFANPEFVGPVLADQMKPYYRSRWYQANKELENNCDYGFNCIGTASDNYPEDSRTNVNKDFRMNASEYGFVGIPYEEMLPGDIVQVGEHGMIFDSFNGSTPTFNYSDGHIGPDAYKKQGKYPSNRYSVFRYVGTPGLIQQWTEEYNAQNKKLGGKINRFDDGGPTKTEQASTSEIPIEFKLGVMDSPFWTYSPEPAPIEPEIPYAHNYMSEDDVYKELDSIMSSTRDPKELPGKLDTFLRSQIVGNPNIKYYRDGLIADINHYIKYPYSSIIIHRNNQDIDRLHRATIDGFIPLVEQSRVVLTNAGKSTGIELSTNMLDTLAYKGGIAGAELNRLLGVPAQETGFGKFPGTTYIKPEDITALDDEHDFYGVSRSNFINNYGVNPTELMNNHYYYTNSADQATIGAIARKYGVGHDASGGWADAYIGYNEVTPEVEQAFKDAYWYSTRQRDKEDIFVDPIVQAYELDATGDYNSKMKGHNELVEQRGIELWGSPEIQKWWEETGKAWYEKGLSERRLRIEGENNSK